MREGAQASQLEELSQTDQGGEIAQIFSRFPKDKPMVINGVAYGSLAILRDTIEGELVLEPEEIRFTIDEANLSPLKDYLNKTFEMDDVNYRATHNTEITPKSRESSSLNVTYTMIIKRVKKS